ncbi:MAG: TonB-dependent receptor [Gammaproteobacteria bacterium]
MRSLFVGQRRHRRGVHLKSSLATAVLLCTGAPVLPAAAQEGGKKLEEVVVTATRREESLQEIPVAVSALTTESLETLGVRSVSDLQRGAIPSLNAQPFAGRPNDLQITVRGIGETDPVQTTLDRAVPIYMDGVYLARTPGASAELTDIERMEILRGPQGIAFGRNAMGGAISLTSVKPSDKFEFREDLTYGNRSYLRSKTTINTPQWNGLSARFTYLNRSLDGFTELSPIALAKLRAAGVSEELYREDQYGWLETEGYKIALRWQPNEQWDINYSFDKTDSQYIELGNTQVLCPDNRPPSSFASCSTLVPGLLGGMVDIGAVPGVEGRLDSTDLPEGIPPGHTISDGHMFTAQFQLNDEITLKSITAFRNMKDKAHSAIRSIVNVGFPNIGLGAFLPISIGDSQDSFHQSQTQWSEEFQVIGSRDRLDYTVGVMYFNEEISSSNWIPYGVVNLGDLPQAVPALFGGFGSGPIPYTAAVQTALINYTNAIVPGLGEGLFVNSFPTRDRGGNIITNRVSTTSVGVYGQGKWTPPVMDDRLHLTFGLRYSHDRKTLIKNDGINLLGVAPFAYPVLELPIDRVDPMASVRYNWSDKTSTYVSYGRAYRNGGASTRETILPGVTILGQPDNGFHTFEAEQVETWEIGVKSDFWDDRARVNAAVFRSEYDGHQISIQKPGQISNTYFFNYPETITVKGLEVETTLQPIDGLTLNINYSWLDDEIPRPSPDPGFAVLPFTILAQAPTHRWSIAMDYVFPQMSFGTLTWHMDMNGSSPYNFNDASNRTGIITGFRNTGGDGLQAVNMRLTLADVPLFGDDRHNVRVAAFANNITDNEYGLYGYHVPTGPNGELTPTSSRVYNEPRTFGVNVIYNFQ